MGLGYPINSPYDEKNISLTQDGSSGFISSIREGGFGKYDIYKISYLNEPIRRVIYLVDFSMGVVDKKVVEQH